MCFEFSKKHVKEYNPPDITTYRIQERQARAILNDLKQWNCIVNPNDYKMVWLQNKFDGETRVRVVPHNISAEHFVNSEWKLCPIKETQFHFQ